jgi:hypothetical protein
MRHVVHFSGGLCSFWAAHRVVQEHGKWATVLLFCDTQWEDPDLYRFNREASEYLDVPITVLSDGRNPWEVFRDERMIGSSRVDLCSRMLKRDLLDQWRRANTTPDNAIFYLGLDWTEPHRMNGTDAKPGGMKSIFAPWRVEAPMMGEPIWDKCRMIEEAKAIGLTPPRLYGMGFPHNNCGGFCVKAGQAHFAHLHAKLPDVYARNEAEEEATRAIVGDFSVMKDRRGGGPRRTMTMRDFRARIEAGEEFDRNDWGGCGCSVELQPVST